jgi:glycolate oxidase FAD binding subunit
VVKNVTGYDLSKAMAGSWGTLAVVTDLTFKVLPAAETEATLALRGLSDEQVAAVMAHAMGSSAEVSGAAHLPYLVSGLVAGGALAGEAATVLRLEGVAPSVAWRSAHLTKLLGAAGECQQIDAETSRALWRDIRDCAPFASTRQNWHKPVWRVSMAPSEGWKMIDALRRTAGVNAFYDWQGGLIWLMMEGDPEAKALRAAISRFGGGHATLIRARPAERAAIPVFEPQPPALAALSARLKDEFDPKGILNPGRMEAGL